MNDDELIHKLQKFCMQRTAVDGLRRWFMGISENSFAFDFSDYALFDIKCTQNRVKIEMMTKGK